RRKAGGGVRRGQYDEPHRLWGPLRRVEGERLRKGAVAERLIRVHGNKAHPDRPWGGDLRVRRRGATAGYCAEGPGLLEMGRTGLINAGIGHLKTSCYSCFCPY